MSSLDHIHPKLRSIADLPQDERIDNALRDRWVGYPDADRALSLMEDLLQAPPVLRPDNLLVRAETNNGKSSLLDRFLDLHPPHVDERLDRTVVPVLRFEMPPEASQDAIYREILNQAKVPYRATQAKEMKALQLFQVLPRLGVRMLLIDELHVVQDAGRSRQGQVLDTLKYLGNKLRIPIVAAGTRAAHRAVCSDPQLENRFVPVDLPRWKLNQSFRLLLAGYEQTLPLREPSELASRDLAMKIYGMSDGLIGEIAKIIWHAAAKALSRGEERITPETMDRLDWTRPSQRRAV